MLSPEEVKVRESLFSASSAQATAAKDDDDTGGGASADNRRNNERDLLCGEQRTEARTLPAIAGWKAGRGTPWRSLFARKPRSAKRAIINAPWTCPMAAHHLAALHIQCRIRGFLLRSRNSNLYRENSRRSAERSSKTAPMRRNGRRRSRVGSRQLDKYLRFVASSGSGEDGAGAAGGGGGYSDWCAQRIQAWWRMIIARFKYQYLKYPIYGLAALQIQYLWKNYQQNAIYDMSTREIKDTSMGSLLDTSLDDAISRQSREEINSREDRAATVIQDCWRRRVAQSIYRYYRNVIDFRLGGDPRLLLRAINPGEAALFDRAAGVHLRFRLGGYSFPPSIYYKVYTHQPVADIGAFAPRSYVEDIKETPGERWNHPPKTGYAEHPTTGRIRVGASYFAAAVKRTGPQGTKNWYRREENNGWRPITIKTLSSAESDPVTIETAKTPPVRSGEGPDLSPSGGFHFSNLVREECRVARMKRRKRRWLKSMYAAGLAETTASGIPQRQQQQDGQDFDHRKQQPEQGAISEPFPESFRDLLPRGRTDGGSGHTHHNGGLDGTPGLEGGVCRAGRGVGLGGGCVPWDYSAHGVGDGTGKDEDGALLVKWSEELDFDRYITEWRQIATSGPSEPWRNADDYAATVASAVALDAQRKEDPFPTMRFATAPLSRGPEAFLTEGRDHHRTSRSVQHTGFGSTKTGKGATAASGWGGDEGGGRGGDHGLGGSRSGGGDYHRGGDSGRDVSLRGWSGTQHVGSPFGGVFESTTFDLGSSA